MIRNTLTDVYELEVMSHLRYGLGKLMLGFLKDLKTRSVGKGSYLVIQPKMFNKRDEITSVHWNSKHDILVIQIYMVQEEFSSAIIICDCYVLGASPSAMISR